jgi:two-component system nitrate/nitrite response regulator NarL
MRILLCDDHVLFVEAFSAALKDRGHEVVAEVTDVAEVLSTTARTRPDICVLDVQFPTGDGIMAATQIVEQRLCDRVVMLSETTDAKRVHLALNLGVRGFISKTRGLDSIMQLLHRVMAGETVIDVGQHKRRAELTTAHTLARSLSSLTQREAAVLNRLAAGLSTNEIAQTLDISRSTARTHVQNVLDKLGVHTRLQAVMLLMAATREAPSEVATG